MPLKTKLGKPTDQRMAMLRQQVTDLLTYGKLETTIDSLMYDNLNVLTTQYDADIKDIVDDCTDREKAIILDVVRQLKVSLRSN